MKKRVFSFMAVIMFTSTLLSAAPKVEVEIDCAAEAYEWQGELEDDGFSKEFANRLANRFYEICMSF